jgi:hypothetical protein
MEPMMTRKSALAFCFSASLLLLSMLTAACGVKPSHVDPPPGAENTDFPRTYPAPDEP